MGKCGAVKVARAAGVVALAVGVLAGCGSEADRSGTATPASTPSQSASEASVGASVGASVEAAPLSSRELQGRWWTWAASEPEATNPVADEDGGDCARNQPDDVWFLAGTFGTRAERMCPVPAGVLLAFPLVNLVGTEESCADFMGTAEGSAVLDGKPVEAETYRGDAITARGVDGNPVTGDGGAFTGTGCGMWVRLDALSPGNHTLKIRGSSGDFSTGVDYSLAVAAP